MTAGVKPRPRLHSSVMAEKKRSGFPPPLPSHQNGRIKCPVPRHPNGGLEAGTGGSAAPPPAPGRTSSSPLRTLRTLGGLMSPVAGPGPEGSPGSSRPRGQSLGSALSSRTRSLTSRTKRRSSQQEEPEDLLDLILECQGQRLEDQRASLSLLPDPGPAALCGACSPDQPPLPSLDFYYMLIHYQSDRMEDQRCSLPDLEDVVVPGQEDFFSLVQRVQSRRMEEQRAVLTHREEANSSSSSSSRHQRP